MTPSNSVRGPETALPVQFDSSASHKSGIYLLTGTDPETGKPAIYVGEAECIRDRIKNHSDRDFWNQVNAHFVHQVRLSSNSPSGSSTRTCGVGDRVAGWVESRSVLFLRYRRVSPLPGGASYARVATEWKVPGGARPGRGEGLW
jgi:hypothetical protein